MLLTLSIEPMNGFIGVFHPYFYPLSATVASAEDVLGAIDAVTKEVISVTNETSTTKILPLSRVLLPSVLRKPTPTTKRNWRAY